MFAELTLNTFSFKIFFFNNCYFYLWKTKLNSTLFFHINFFTNFFFKKKITMSHEIKNKKKIYFSKIYFSKNSFFFNLNNNNSTVVPVLCKKFFTQIFIKSFLFKFLFVSNLLNFFYSNFFLKLNFFFILSFKTKKKNYFSNIFHSLT